MSDIRSLVLEKLKRADPYAKRYRDVATINERFVLGDQWGSVSWNGGNQSVFRDAWFDAEGVPRIAINHLSNLLLTWSSLLTKDRQVAVAVPATDEPSDTYSAQIAQKVIEFLSVEVDSKNKIHRTVQYAGQGGTAGLKIIYSAVDDAVTWEPVSVHGYYIDPVQDYHTAKWVIFERYISQEDAKEHYERIGIEREPHETQYKNGANEDLHGVKAYELWLKPCKQYPKGLYAFLVDDETVEAMDYPYIFTDDSGHEEYILPIVLMKVREIRDSAYGATNMSDCVPLQRAHNEVNARILKIVRQTSNPQLIVPKELAESMDLNRSNIIAFGRNEIEGAKLIGFTSPPQLPQGLFDLREYYEKAMAQVIGLNEVTAGTQTRSISGRAIDNIVELDAQKNADASKSCEQMILDAWRLSLALVQRYYSEPRKAKISGGTTIDVVTFSGADIQGVDIRLEPGSEIDQTKASKEAKIIERMQTGAATPMELVALQNPQKQGLSRRAAEDVIAQYLAGQTIDISPDDIDPTVFQDAIAKAQSRALADGNRADWVALAKLSKMVVEMAQQAQNASPQEAQQPQNEPQQGGQ